MQLQGKFYAGSDCVDYNSIVKSAPERNLYDWTIDLLCAAGFFILVFALSLRRLADYDLWGHLKAGEYLFKTGTILTTHYFNCNRPEFPYLNHEWLFQGITYGLYNVGGEAALIVLQIILVLASFFLLYRTARLYSANIPLIVAVLGLGLLASSHRLILRPQHFSYLFLLVNLFAFHQYLRGNSRYLYLLPPVMLLWVNIHAESLWGIIVPLVFLVVEWATSRTRKERTESLKKPAVIFLLVVLASLINPFTYKTVFWPFLVMSEQFSGVEELLSPTTLRYFTFWIYFCVFLFVVIFRFRKIRPSVLALSIFFAAVAWTANRGIPHFVFASAAIVVSGLGREGIMMATGRLSKALGSLVLLLLVLLTVSVVSDRRYFRKFDSVPYPEGAVRFIKDKNIQGNMFNLHGWGGYLVWELFPQVKTYIDNRFFYRKFFEEYEAILSGGRDWQALLDRYGITLVLLDYSPSSDINLRDYLFTSADWRLVYWDDFSLLYLKRYQASSSVIDRYSMRLVNPDTDRFRVGAVNAAVMGAALQEVLGSTENAGGSWKVNFMAGNLFYASGDVASAVNSFEKAIRLSPDPVPAISFNLGQAYLSAGRLADAEKSFITVTRLASDTEAFRALWRIYLLEGRRREADEIFRKHLQGR